MSYTHIFVRKKDGTVRVGNYDDSKSVNVLYGEDGYVCEYTKSFLEEYYDMYTLPCFIDNGAIYNGTKPTQINFVEKLYYCDVDNRFKFKYRSYIHDTGKIYYYIDIQAGRLGNNLPLSDEKLIEFFWLLEGDAEFVAPSIHPKSYLSPKSHFPTLLQCKQYYVP